MSRAARHTGVEKCLLAAVLFTLAAAVPQTWATEDVTGEWAVAVDTDFGPMQGTLTLEKKPDGALAGQWGAVALSNVKFEDDQLTFTRTIPTPNGDMTQDFKGTVKDGKLTGITSGEQGESKVTGAKRRPMPSAVGVWDLKYTVGDRDVTARLVVSQKPDGPMGAKWLSPMGESVISNVKVQDDKITFDRVIKLSDQEIRVTFGGTIQGDKLSGVSQSDMGEIPVAGTRFGGEIIGKWEVTSVSDIGTFTSLMVIHPDLTGTYEVFSDVPMKDLRFENGQLTFAVQFGPEDQPFKMDFKGKVEGKTLKGQMTSGMGTSQVMGKKLQAAPAAATETIIKPMTRPPDVIYVPTPQKVVDKMLELAEVKPGDVVYDLGCGDGRIVVTAAKKYGVKAYGFDINPERIEESLKNVRENHVENLVTIKQEDIFTLDLSKASVITLYLLPSLNVKLMPQLAQCKPGTRIVSHDFAMRGAKPVVVHEMTAESDSDENAAFGPSHTIYKWVVPWEKE
jgi:hypothetical protein